MDFTKFTKPARKVLPLKKCGAVIVAAGSASRMGGIDKVMASVGGEPMIRRTARAFQNCDAYNCVFGPTPNYHAFFKCNFYN